MADEGLKLYAHCGKCGGDFNLDPAVMAERYGRDFCLWNKIGPCKTPGCSGSCAFHYISGGPSRVMLDRNVYHIGNQLIRDE